MHHISSVADWYFWLYEWFCDEGVGEKLKKIFELNQLSIAHFVDFDEINKKVTEGNLPGSLLCGIRSTQMSKISQKRSKIGPQKIQENICLYSSFCRSRWDKQKSN